jgi:hypothetical protein
LVNVDFGSVMFFQTDVLLSQHMFVGSSIGTPNIRGLYRKASTNSIAFFIDVNSDPKVDASNKFCCLLNHMVGTLLQSNRIPVCDRIISVSPA